MSRRQKLRRVLIGFGLLISLIALYLFWPERADVAAYANLGAQYDVEIRRDSWGVPHIFGQTDADAAFGLAYAHAEDDFRLIQETLAATRGQLAYFNGPDGAPVDYLVQLLRTWETIDAKYASELSPETRALLQGYADGLNFYASQHEADALAGLYPVTGQDIVAGFIVRTPLFFGFDGVVSELFADSRQRPVSPEAAADDDLDSWNYYGSNVIAVAPQRTIDNETYLAINSHQPWEGPVTWYEAHVHSEAGWDMTGGLFPGAPIILQGHNQYLGWGFTVNSPDLVDVFVLEINPDNPDQYWFDGAWRDLEVATAEIPVRLLGRFRWTVKREILWSVYGPAVRQPHGTYALRYATMGEVDLVESWYALNKATDFASWQATLFASDLPMFNVGYADREGNIYYLYNARLPLRAEGYDWEQYLPGDSSATLWTDYLPPADLPQVLNPTSGFIQNANSSPFQTTVGPENPDPAGFSPTFGIESRMTNRALRLLALFGDGNPLSFDQFTAYKYDITYAAESVVGELWQLLLAADFSADPEAAAAQALLAGWDHRAAPDSPSAALMLLTLYFVNQREDVHLNASQLVGGEVSDADLEAAFRQAIAHLDEHFQGLATPWSAVNRLERGELNLGLGGGPDLPHAVYGQFNEAGQLIGGNGDSHILLVRWNAAGQVSSYSIHQYGSATAVPESPHYNDQAPLFVNRELKPVWFTAADIQANLSHAYRPGAEP